MLAGDSSKVKSQINKTIELLKKEFGSDFKTDLIGFGSKTSVNPTLNFSEKETDFSELFNYIELNYQNRNTGALVLLSDGIINKGNNPLFRQNNFAFPIYSIAYGDTSEKKDALISRINNNPSVFLGNRFPIEAYVKANFLKDSKIKVGVYKNGRLLSEKELLINNNNFYNPVQFVLDAESPGVNRYDVVLSKLEGEYDYENNRQSFIVEVIDNREKILLLYQNPHPDIAAISESIESSKMYELSKEPIQQFQKPIKTYGLVIIHGYTGQNELSIIEQCKANQISYFVINPQQTINLPMVRISSGISKANEAEPILQKNFGLFGLSDELKAAIKNWPAVRTFFGNYVTNNGSQILISQKIGAVETNDPILLFQDENNYKQGLLLGDGIWKWRMKNYQDKENFNAFNELINKSIQYLTIKNDKSFFRVFAPKILNENEPLEFSAEVYNKAYELITDPEVFLTLKNSSGKSFSYTFSKSENAYKLQTGLHEPGEYSYEAKVKVGNELFVKKGVVVVKEMVAEKSNTTANHRLLYEISKISSGEMLYPEQTEKLIKLIKDNEYIKPMNYQENTTTELIDLKWLFFIIILLFAAEWLIRKISGTI